MPFWLKVLAQAIFAEHFLLNVLIFVRGRPPQARAPAFAVISVGGVAGQPRGSEIDRG